VTRLMSASRWPSRSTNSSRTMASSSTSNSRPSSHAMPGASAPDQRRALTGPAGPGPEPPGRRDPERPEERPYAALGGGAFHHHTGAVCDRPAPGPDLASGDVDLRDLVQVVELRHLVGVHARRSGPSRCSDPPGGRTSASTGR
jgi:hypothetical protein